ncbi:MAG TPA: Xaa-Pro peptidase family protein [Chthonomonadales bacterium]|nr:Xaa-Pro peptidase family protein [Chthonomonadales bacterium]
MGSGLAGRGAPLAALAGLFLAGVGALRLGQAAAPAGSFGIAATEYATRRESVARAAGGALVLVHASAASEHYRIGRPRADSDLFYLSGVETPGAVLALLPPGDPAGRRSVLFLPHPAEGMERWVTPWPGPDDGTRARAGVDAVADVQTLWSELAPAVRRATDVRVVGPVDAARNALIVGRVRALNPEARVLGGAERWIHALRARKSDAEVANIRLAIEATIAGHRAAARAVRPGVTELAVEGATIAAFRTAGAVREGFAGVVGSGPFSTVLHHRPTERVLKRGDLVVVDIGAERNYYTADLTRTYPTGGRFTPRQRAIYELVLEAQRACEQMVEPGRTTYDDLTRRAREVFQRSPLRARDEDGAEVTLERFFPHTIGHPIGLDVHDVGDLGVLHPGTVFSIEPGLYIPSENLGVRIEDNYLVTATGLEKLSRALPSEPAAIEALMRAR